VNPVSLKFSTVSSKASSGPHGFLCEVDDPPAGSNEDGRLMAGVAHGVAVARNIDTTKACVVVDVVEWGEDFPGCRAAELLEFCRDPEHACTPGVRGKVEVTVPEAGTIAERITQALESLAEEDPVLGNTPDTPVMVRVFATFQPCNQLRDIPEDDPEDDGGRTDPDLLFGCAHSCPVRLDDVTGELSLDLDTLDSECEPSVRACARPSFATEPGSSAE
jgi:hypothetical protein